MKYNISDKSKGLNLLFFLIVFSILTNFGINFLFLSEGVYYHSFGEHLAADRIVKLIELSQKWQLLAYLFIPIVVLIRVSYTAICLYSGFFLPNFKVSFNYQSSRYLYGLVSVKYEYNSRVFCIKHL